MTRPGRYARHAAVGAVLLLSALAALTLALAAEPVPPFGTAQRPFSAQSPWNARPLAPEFGSDEIPRSKYFPNLAEGAWSTGVFVARPDDPPVTIVGLPGRPLWDHDLQQAWTALVIPRWPADVVPASGADGHAEIIDPVSGIVHSFYKLRQVDGQWQSAQYAWTRLDGRGWGEPAHFYQGARAVGVPPLGGLIRKHEVDDGQPVYRHALAMSLTFNALSPDPAYVFPATVADKGAEKTNSGRIPEGALLMLPPDFDVERIGNERLRKVARTLQVYGAYVVDRNDGAPFSIYVENGTGFGLHKPVWNPAVARELDRIRGALRQVVAARGWLDGEGRPTQLQRHLNLLSLRGPWVAADRSGAQGRFDTWAQAVVFEAGSPAGVLRNEKGIGLRPVNWALPQPGDHYRITSHVVGKGSLRLQFFEDRSQRVKLFDSGELRDGQSAVFAWPQPPHVLVLNARRDEQAGGSSVGASLVAAEPEPAR